MSVGNRHFIPNNVKPGSSRSARRLKGLYAYDVKRSAENGQPTYCVVGKTRKSFIEESNNSADSDSIVFGDGQHA
jgi:hypothetical protein